MLFVRPAADAWSPARAPPPLPPPRNTHTTITTHPPQPTPIVLPRPASARWSSTAARRRCSSCRSWSCHALALGPITGPCAMHCRARDATQMCAPTCLQILNFYLVCQPKRRIPNDASHSLSTSTPRLCSVLRHVMSRPSFSKVRLEARLIASELGATPHLPR